MAGASERLWSPGRPPRRTPAHGLWLLFFLFAIALTAIAAVVTATMMGQPTVALVIGLLSAAFFAGMLC